MHEEEESREERRKEGSNNKVDVTGILWQSVLTKLKNISYLYKCNTYKMESEFICIIFFFNSGNQIKNYGSDFQNNWKLSTTSLTTFAYVLNLIPLFFFTKFVNILKK